jgi:hypothetical protein
MAKRRRAATATRAISVYRPPAPIIRVSAPRAVPKKKHHRRRHSGGGELSSKTMLGSALGGAALGFVEKMFPNRPYH